MKTYTFTARIEAGPGGGAFVFFPYYSAAEFGTRGAVPVKATFTGVVYAGSLMACRGPQHMLGVLKGIREQIGKSVGDPVDVVVWREVGERTVEVPEAFAKAMKKAGVLAFFEQLSFTHRTEYCWWIADAKKEETRARRLEKAIEMLKRGVKTPG
jgi:hypothetical protein